MKSIYKYSSVRLIISIILVVMSLVFLTPIIRDSFLRTIGVYISPDRLLGLDFTGLENIRDIYGIEGGKIYFITRFI